MGWFLRRSLGNKKFFASREAKWIHKLRLCCVLGVIVALERDFQQGFSHGVDLAYREINEQ
jgi:hypothetical protein